MIVNFMVGESDSGQNGICILETLEGPLSELDLEQMWHTFEQNIQGTIGPRPISRHGDTADEDTKLRDEWNANSEAIHNSLRQMWNIPAEHKGFMNTRYFIEFLIKHHGYKRVETIELFTENY